MRGNLYRLPVPQIEALALPDVAERATQNPTQNMMINTTPMPRPYNGRWPE